VHRRVVPLATQRAADRRQGVEPGQQRGIGGATRCDAPGRLVDTVEEGRAARRELAPGELEQRRRVRWLDVPGDAVRDTADRVLVTALGEVVVVDGEQKLRSSPLQP